MHLVQRYRIDQTRHNCHRWKRIHWVIIKVTCPHESSKEYLHQRKLEKERKYHFQIPDELWQAKCNTGEVVGIVIGTVGTIREDSHRAIKRLGLINQSSTLQMIAMNSSVILLNKYFNTGDFHKKKKKGKYLTTVSKHWNIIAFQEHRFPGVNGKATQNNVCDGHFN